MAEPILALQTWTVRDLLKTHRLSTLSAIREMGFKYLELAGNAGMSPQDFANLCRDHGFTVIGVHQPPLTSADLDDLITETIEHCKAHECSLATVMLGQEDAEAEGAARQQAFVRYAALASEAGKRLREHGITLFYHCYPYDIEPLQGPEGLKSGLEILLERVTPEDMAFELDVHFLYRAEVRREEVLQKCGPRCQLLHINDITELGKGGRSAILGQGKIDWVQLMGHIREYCAPDWFILEHTSPDPLTWIEESRKYWKANIAPLQDTGGAPQ